MPVKTGTAAAEKKRTPLKTIEKTVKKPPAKKTTKQPIKAKPKASAKPKKPPKKAIPAKKIKVTSRVSLAKKNQKKPEINTEANCQVLLDCCGVELTPKMRDFLINYITPGQPCFHNALQAALKAGYAEETAKCNIYKALTTPDIQKIIKKNEAMAHQSLHEAAKRAIQIKQQRAFYDPIDFFENKTITDRAGRRKSVMALKNMGKMTAEQRMCIDGMDVKGQAGIPIYIMPDREKELNDIIKMDTELSKSIGDTSEEETREIIIERITIRETKRAERPAEMEYEIVERPPETDETEEEDDV